MTGVTGATGIGVTGATGETPNNALQFYVRARKVGSVLTGWSSVSGTILIWRTDGFLGVEFPAGTLPPLMSVPLTVRIRVDDDDVYMSTPESDATMFSSVDSSEVGAFGIYTSLAEGRTVTLECTVLQEATIIYE